MHWTVHILVGANTGLLVQRTRTAFLLGVLEHLVLDAIPHHDPEHNIGYVLDSLLGAGVFWLLLNLKRKEEKIVSGMALSCAVGSALPDVELLARAILGHDRRSYVFPSHNGAIPHRETGRTSSYLIEAVLVVATFAIAITCRGRRLKEDVESGVYGG